jgi:hypothetical protein
MATIGRKQAVGIGLQTTRGTAADADYWIQKTAFEFNRAVNHQNDESALGVSADSQGVGVSQKSAVASLSAYLEVAAAGLFEWAAGESYADAANADASGIVYDHTSKGGIDPCIERLLTVQVDDPCLEGDQSIADAILNTYTINANTSERMSCDFEFVSKHPEAASHTTAFTAPTNFFGKNVTVKVASAVSGLSGASAIPVKGMAFTRNFNINNDDNAFNLGDVDIVDHHKQEFGAEVTLNKFLENQTYIDAMEAGTEYAMEISIVDTATTIGTAANPAIVYTFPKVSVQSVTGGDNASLRTEDLTLKVHYGEDDVEAASYQWKSVTTNLVANYEV